MNRFRITKKSSIYLWIALLSISLICTQGVKLHVHSLGHDHGHHQHHHNSITSKLEHTHMSIAHLSSDSSHSDHHEEVLSESDVCPDGLLFKLTGKVPFMALLVILFTWFLFGLFRNTFIRRQDSCRIWHWRCHLFPPLRAPPLVA